METSWSDDRSMSYHLGQFENQKRSTVCFQEFTEEQLNKSRTVVDVGCGGGAATYFLASQHKKTHFIGFDSDPALIRAARQATKDNHLPNLDFELGDIYKIGAGRFEPDGVISLQTLSWLPSIEDPMISIFINMKPKWIALSSLFYEGDVTATVIVDEHQRSRQSFYNVYSIPKLNRLAKQFGYNICKIEKFLIDVDLPKPTDLNFMSTYTELLASEGQNHRIQISGPLLMNWYFLLLQIQEA
jgi:SAM-dependent methyltransferase